MRILSRGTYYVFSLAPARNFSGSSDECHRASLRYGKRSWPRGGRMKSLCNLAKGADENAIWSLGKRRIRMETAIHVLYVGPVDRCGKIYDALLDGPRFRLTITTDYRELWEIPRHESPQVVILHNTLSTFELEFVSLFIRQRWPRAKFLVVCSEKSFLDDPLYDECVQPAVAPEILHSTIDRLKGW